MTQASRYLTTLEVSEEDRFPVVISVHPVGHHAPCECFELASEIEDCRTVLKIEVRGGIPRTIRAWRVLLVRGSDFFGAACEGLDRAFAANRHAAAFERDQNVVEQGVDDLLIDRLASRQPKGSGQLF